MSSRPAATRSAWTSAKTACRSASVSLGPIVLAGSCGNHFRTGQYLEVTAQEDPMNDIDTPHNKLATMFLDATGVTAPVQIFGAYGEPGEFDMLRA